MATNSNPPNNSAYQTPQTPGVTPILRPRIHSAKNPGKWGNEIKISVVTASKGKTNVTEVSGDDKTGKVYTVANASAFAEGDTVAIKVNGKVTGYNKIAQVVGNTITFTTAVKEDLVDNTAVPKKFVVSAELNVEVAYKDNVEVYEGVSFNAASAGYITKVLAKSELVDAVCADTTAAVAPISYFTSDAEAEKAVILLSGGSDGSLKGITPDIFMGVDNGPGKRTGLAAFKEINNVSIMAIPGVTDAAVQLADFSAPHL